MEHRGVGHAERKSANVMKPFRNVVNVKTRETNVQDTAPSLRGLVQMTNTNPRGGG